MLELILALALSVLVLSAVGMAINLYFKMLDVRRTSLEEMQVVRVVTQRMTNDLRMMVQPNQPDLSGLETAMQNAMQAALQQTAAASGVASTVISGVTDLTTGVTTVTGGGGGTGSQAGGGQAGGGAPGGSQTGAGGQGAGGQASGGQASGGQASGGQASGGQGGAGGQAQGGAGAGGASASGAAAAGSGTGAAASGSTGAAASGSSTDATAAQAAPAVVKLVGTATELQFDISRLPRVDQYKQIVLHSGQMSAVDLPSDVKTIAYFIRSEQSAKSYADDPRATGGEASTDGYGRGLMRAEMDRAVTLYADAGAGGSVYSGAQLLANEVVGLGFEYFDGTDFLTEWDSASLGTLPRAIRVWLSVQPTYGMSEQELAAANQGKGVEPTDFYFVISLPTVPVVAAAAVETTDTSGTSSSSSGSSSSGSTATGTTP